MKKHKLAIIGGGPCALYAAVAAATEGLEAKVIVKDFGGQIVQTPRLENLIGYPEGISGHDFIERSVKQCRHFGVHFIHHPLGAQRLIKRDSEWEIVLPDKSVNAKAVVLAVGQSWRQHPVIDRVEQKENIYYGPKRTVDVPQGRYVVIGSANSAAQGILELAERGCEVIVLARHELECSDYLQKRIKTYARDTKSKGIHVMTNTICNRVDCDKDGIYLVHTSNQFKPIVADGIFAMIGLQPNTAFLRDSGLEINNEGFIVTDSKFNTSLPGIFAAGDCRNDVIRRNVGNAIGDGNAVFKQAWAHLCDKPPGQSSS